MNPQHAGVVDDYLAGLFIGNDPALDRALASSHAAGLPPIAVSQVQGKLLYLLARTCGARRILEIGTLGGYSAICLARALPADGSLISLEIDPKHAAVARDNIVAAGLSDIVSVVVAPALESLAQLQSAQAEPFDLVFIDADKPNNPKYLRAALALAHPGTLVVVDNVVRGGAVVDGSGDDPNIAGTRACLEMMAHDPRLESTAIQTVGHKGYDGFALGRVRRT
jgi:predicted O-methyltransferase YrrM